MSFQVSPPAILHFADTPGTNGVGAGGGGIIAQAGNVLTKLQKVISPPELPPHLVQDEATQIKNQNILTRFVSEFNLEKEALQFQKTVNKVIIGINNFLEPGNAPSNKIDKIGTPAHVHQEVSGGGKNEVTNG